MKCLTLFNDIDALSNASQDWKSTCLSTRDYGLNKLDTIILKSFFEDLKIGLGFAKTFKEYRNKKANLFIGDLACSYNPGLKTEAAIIQEVHPSIEELKNKPTHIRSVNIVKSTKGLRDEQVVAIFPEIFKNHIVKPRDTIFYFVNKFKDRHYKYTHPFIENNTVNFPFNLECDHLHISQLISNWVTLHEKFHREGKMPIPLYLFEKSNRYSAGIEELRADLMTMQYCLKHSTSTNDEYALTYQYVLAERLLSYPLYRDVDRNFDAISSTIFLQHLINSNIVEIKNQKIVFKDELEDGIVTLLEKINRVECKAIKLKGEQQRKDYLVQTYKNWFKNSQLSTRYFRGIK